MHFEVFAQQEQKQQWPQEEGGRVSEQHILLCWKKAGKQYKTTCQFIVMLMSDYQVSFVCFFFKDNLHGFWIVTRSIKHCCTVLLSDLKRLTASQILNIRIFPVTTFCIPSSLLRVTDTPTVGCRSAGRFCLVLLGGLSIKAPSSTAALLSRSTKPTDRTDREMLALPREWLPQHKWIWIDTNAVIEHTVKDHSVCNVFYKLHFNSPLNQAPETGRSGEPVCCCGYVQKSAQVQSWDSAGCGKAHWWCHSPVKSNRKKTLTPLLTDSLCW